MQFNYGDFYKKIGYEKHTIHYKVTATTGANLPLSQIVSVVDLTNACNEHTLAFSDNNAFTYQVPVYTEEILTGDDTATQVTNSNIGICPIYKTLIYQKDLSPEGKPIPLNTIQSGIIYWENEVIKVDSKLFDGVEFEAQVQIITAFDKPIIKNVVVSRMPNFKKTVGICKVKSEINTYPANTSTFDNVESMIICRGKCLNDPACTGF